MPSEKVTDLGYERTPMGQILGYGTFIFESAGQDQALDRVTWVPRPDSRYRLIIAALFHPDAADAEAAAQANPDVRPQAAPSTDSPAPAPPPALMPRIGRRSNPADAAHRACRSPGAAQPRTAWPREHRQGRRDPGSEEPARVTWAATGAAPTAGDTGVDDSRPRRRRAARGPGPGHLAARLARARDAAGEHVPGGPTSGQDASEVRPEPFIEGGKDPKIR